MSGPRPRLTAPAGRRAASYLPGTGLSPRDGGVGFDSADGHGKGRGQQAHASTAVRVVAVVACVALATFFGYLHLLRHVTRLYNPPQYSGKVSGSLLADANALDVFEEMQAAGERRPRIVFAITARSDQEATLTATLQSLLSQRRRFDHGYVVIPADSGRSGGGGERRGGHLDASAFTGVTVVRPAVDSGPVSHLLHALQAERDPDTVVVIVDANKVYSPLFVEAIEARTATDKSVAVSVCGWSLFPFADTVGGQFLRVRAPQFARGPHGILVDVLDGSCGAAYRVGFFNMTELSSADLSCRWADDVLVAFHLARQGVPRLLMQGQLGHISLTAPHAAPWVVRAKAHGRPKRHSGEAAGSQWKCMQWLQARYGPWPTVAAN